MKSPPKKEKPGAPSRRATRRELTLRTHRIERDRLEASLARRLNRVASVSELMPQVFAITLALGTRSRQNTDQRHIAQRVSGANG